MASNIPERLDEIGDDDIQAIQRDPLELARKYIIPIDRIRSVASPKKAFSGNADDGFEGLEFGGIGKRESRAHAFYRYIGFPVATPNGFYNPGFDPTGNATLGKKTGINAEFNKSPFKNLIDEREIQAEDLRKIFLRQDLSSSVYAILLRHVRFFQVLRGDDPFGEDSQDFDIDSREFEALDFFTSNPNLNEISVKGIFGDNVIGINYTGVRHILRPFVVDPRIDNTVMPAQNRVAVPFLQNKDSLKIEKNKSVLRPGLEFIIRERLRDTDNDDVTFLENVRRIVNKEKIQRSDPKSLDEESLHLIVDALLEDNEIKSSAIESDLKGFTTRQVLVVSRLVKTLKAVIVSLHESVQVIDNTRQEIDWIPVPSKEGPERGVEGVKFSDESFSSNTKIDKRIKELRIRKITAERKVQEDIDLGNFAYPAHSGDTDLSRLNDELNNLISTRDRVAEKAYKAMQKIELISGEVSGLGLVDILAIYITLWSMNERSLISLLDESAFVRMISFNPVLGKKGAAADRANNGIKDNIVDALKGFEKKLINVLSFADREFNRQLVAPGIEPGGSVSIDS